MEEFINQSKLRRMIGVTYLGGVKTSSKVVKSLKNQNVLTYILYLAPSDLSGYNVCPNDSACRDLCLNGSGRNKLQKMAGQTTIEKARIAKTRFLYEHEREFMMLLIQEIRRWIAYSNKEGYEFSVRLNGTSDINWSSIRLDGKCIFEWFPEVQFYDYTKVYSYHSIPTVYKNYNLTYSYNGYNWPLCEKWLRMGGNVAVVIDSPVLPKSYRGWKCVDGNLSDARYLDEKPRVVYLKFKRVASQYKKGVYTPPTTPFVVKEDDENIVW